MQNPFADAQQFLLVMMQTSVSFLGLFALLQALHEKPADWSKFTKLQIRVVVGLSLTVLAFAAVPIVYGMVLKLPLDLRWRVASMGFGGWVVLFAIWYDTSRRMNGRGIQVSWRYWPRILMLVAVGLYLAVTGTVGVLETFLPAAYCAALVLVLLICADAVLSMWDGSNNPKGPERKKAQETAPATAAAAAPGAGGPGSP